MLLERVLYNKFTCTTVQPVALYYSVPLSPNTVSNTICTIPYHFLRIHYRIWSRFNFQKTISASFWHDLHLIFAVFKNHNTWHNNEAFAKIQRKVSKSMSYFFPISPFLLSGQSWQLWIFCKSAENFAGSPISSFHIQLYPNDQLSPF